MAVKKLLRAKIAKTKLRQDALETTFLVFQTFCIYQILAVWGQTRLFQQPRDITSTDHDERHSATIHCTMELQVEIKDQGGRGAVPGNHRADDRALSGVKGVWETR